MTTSRAWQTKKWTYCWIFSASPSSRWCDISSVPWWWSLDIEATMTHTFQEKRESHSLLTHSTWPGPTKWSMASLPNSIHILIPTSSLFHRHQISICHTLEIWWKLTDPWLLWLPKDIKKRRLLAVHVNHYGTLNPFSSQSIAGFTDSASMVLAHLEKV